MYVREPKDPLEFVKFPYNFIKKDPNWVGDLIKSSLSLISDSHPFWDNAEKKLFVAEEKGKILGRICGIINRSYNEFHKEKAAFFGFFDCENDINAAKLLFEAVENWARSKNCDLIRGPANPSSNYTWGMLVENFKEPNVVMMPYNPEYYASLVESSGYKKEKDLYAFKWVYDENIAGNFLSVVERIKKENSEISIEFADVKNINTVFEDFKAVYNKAWENNWGFVPMSEREIENMALELKPLIKKEYIFFAKHGDLPVAFCLLLPDFNIALKALNGSFSAFNIIPFIYNYLFKIKSGRMLALGVNKEYRGRGIEVLMILKAIEIAKDLGWNWGELSWTLEDNIKINRTIEKFGGKIYKKYRIYRKDLV